MNATPRQWLRQRARPHRHWLWLSAAGSLVAAGATIGVSAIIALAVHRALFTPEHLEVAVVLGGGLALIVLRYLAQGLRDLAGQRLAHEVKGALRSELLRRAREAGPARLATAATTGEWIERFQARGEDLTGYYVRYLPALQAVILIPVAILITVFWLDWLAGLLLLFAAPLIPAFMAIVGMGAEQIHRQQQAEQDRLAGHFLDRIRALDWLRRARAIEATQSEVVERSHHQRRLTMRTLRVAFLSSAVMEFFSAVAIGMVAIYIGFALFGALDYGPALELTLFTGLFILLLAPEYFLPLRQFAQSYHDRAGALAAAEALVPLTAPAEPLAAGADPAAAAPPAPAPAPAPVVDQATNDPAARSGPLLELEAVSLRYPGQDAPALPRTTLTIQPGESIAITGPSGAGKSTLLALCAGFLQPDTGRVQRHGDAQSFVWIGQQAHLFHGTLRENLQLARRETIPDAEMASALAQAGLPLQAAELPDGLETAISEQRRGLSGGQAQRVAIARGLLSGYRLWLLDEPTSALDAETEQALLDTLFDLAREHALTLVVATHHTAVQARCRRTLDLGGPPDA
ncbi:thiol reductant ABC exporter subunit CydD [Thioalkalivibrio sp. ALJT]|uniref:thiol reductant ABC exporter subunit CydD n=1 Tax=Thioalkalivibrio sp. ALJT TaxID=1158146 RepID=UPI00047697E9|nr:thiol reductant ABC exporter subunit CydD [Thioalkalivibrio sp. ALJT]